MTNWEYIFSFSSYETRHRLQWEEKTSQRQDRFLFVSNLRDWTRAKRDEAKTSVSNLRDWTRAKRREVKCLYPIFHIGHRGKYSRKYQIKSHLYILHLYYHLLFISTLITEIKYHISKQISSVQIFGSYLN